MKNIQTATKEFIKHCKYEKHLASKTIAAYHIDLAQFKAFLIEKKYSLDPQQISKKELRGYLEKIASLRPKSIKRKLATMKAMFNYLEFEDQITISPFRKMRIKIREEKKLPVVMNISEVKEIFKSANADGESINGSYAYASWIRNMVVIELLFATGARVAEIANIKLTDIDVNSGSLTIHGKGNKERIIQICNTETLTLLRQYQTLFFQKIISAEYFLFNRFGRRLSEQSIRNIVKNICDKSGLQKHITPHVFRHTLATLLLEQEVDLKYIQSLLGHSSIMTTQIYTHVNREKQKQILQSKHPRKYFSTETLVFQ